MKIYPCLLNASNTPSKKHLLYKDRLFYLSLEFSSNNSKNIYKLKEYNYIYFYPRRLESSLKDNIRFDEEEIIISNVLFSSTEKLSIYNIIWDKISIFYPINSGTYFFNIIYPVQQ
jgi:hypothetical protein